MGPMKRCVALVLCLAVIAVAGPSYARGGGGRSGGHSGGSHSTGTHSGDIHVKSYDRKDGTHVDSHERSRPGEGGSSSSPSPSHKGSSAGVGKVHSPSSPHFSATVPGARDGHGRLVRNEAAKREFWRETGYPHGRPGYVVDH